MTTVSAAEPPKEPDAPKDPPGDGNQQRGVDAGHPEKVAGSRAADFIGTKNLGARSVADFIGTRNLGARFVADFIGTRNLGVQSVADFIGTKNLGARSVADFIGTRNLGAQFVADFIDTTDYAAQSIADLLGVLEQVPRADGASSIYELEQPEGSNSLWTPDEGRLVDAGPGLGAVWAEFASDLGLWIVRPKVKAAGIPLAVYLFVAWYFSFSMRYPEVAEELKEILFGILFLVMGKWWSAGRKRD